MTPKALKAIQQELAANSERLGTLLAQASDDEKNQFFQDVGAARYYMEEAHWRIQAVIEQLEKQEEAVS